MFSTKWINLIGSGYIHKGKHVMYGLYIYIYIEAWNTLQEVLVSQQQKPSTKTCKTPQKHWFQLSSYFQRKTHLQWDASSSNLCPAIISNLSSPLSAAFLGVQPVISSYSGFRMTIATDFWMRREPKRWMIKFWSDATGCRLNEDETTAKKWVSKDPLTGTT